MDRLAALQRNKSLADARTEVLVKKMVESDVK